MPVSDSTARVRIAVEPARHYLRPKIGSADPDDDLSPARGIVYAILFALPFWVAAGWMVLRYLVF